MRLNEIKLDKQEQIDLVAGVRGVFALAGIDQYSTMSEAPSFQTDPIDLLISQALNLDLKEDIEQNRTLQAMLKEFKPEIKAFNERIKEEEGYRHLWTNLSDSLQQIICNFLDNDTPITQETKEALDAKLQKYYNGVMDIVEGAKYEITNIELNGEKLYRRVK